MHATSNIVPTKIALRRESKRLRAEIPLELRSAAALRLPHLARRIVSLATAAAGAATPVIAGFMPFGSELDPGPLMQQAAIGGARLALPRIQGNDIEFHSFDRTTRFETGVFGIREPHADAPELQPHLLLVPLLAFDRNGHRLGYGRGYYDRAIARLPKAATVGIAFAAQEVAQVPVEPHDRPLDFVLTENGLIDCRR